MQSFSVERTRLRIRFTKCGDLRWISHRDLARAWERLLRRAGLELAFSQGFHPKPKISFPSALALGIEALDEIVELEIVGAFKLADIESDIRSQMPAGMELLQIESLDEGSGKAKVVAASYRVRVPDERHETIREHIQAVLSQPELIIERNDKKVACSTQDTNLRISLDGEFLTFSIPNDSQGAIRPSELLGCLGLADLLESGALLQRTEVHMQPLKQTESTNGSVAT